MNFAFCHLYTLQDNIIPYFCSQFRIQADAESPSLHL